VLTDLTPGPRASYDWAFAVALQPDGQIVVGGSASDRRVEVALARYHPDGSLDATFGGSGVVRGQPSRLAEAGAVAIRPDGKIVVAGTSDRRVADFALARYRPDGRLDRTFGSRGQVETDFASGRASSLDVVHAMAIHADGRIVVAGDSDANGSNDFALARYFSQ
jgi:uncharacterized delta-60 repeat protein